MKRLSKILSLIVAFIVTCLFSVYAQNEEKLSIVTYYPSPYGSYRELYWGSKPDSEAMLTETGSIELGGTVSAKNPYIKFTGTALGDDASITLNDPKNLTIKAGHVGDGTVNIDQDLVVYGNATIHGIVSSAFCSNYGTNTTIVSCGQFSFVIGCGMGSCASPGKLKSPTTCPSNGYMICVKHAI